MKKYLTLFCVSGILVCFTAAYVHAQQTANDCRQHLVKYLEDISKLKEPAGKKVYRIKYSMQYFYRDKTEQSQSVSADLFISKDKSFYESNVISMYADKKNGFLVMPIQRQIVWGPGGKLMTAGENSKMMFAMQDSLVKHSTIIGCSDVSVDTLKLKQIVLSPPEKVKKALEADKIILTYDYKNNVIRKVVCLFTPQSNKEKVVVNYDIIDFDYKGTFNVSAFNKIFSSKGKLKPQYKDYELIDNRSQN